MVKILKLDQDLVSKISAGEVIERPASIVKELLENSIDAGADNIEVVLSGGGIDFISIVDNGCGIQKDELPKALLPFYTSKLNRENLFNISTLGFRGEALASISSVADILIASKVDGSGGFALENNFNVNQILAKENIDLADFNIKPYPLHRGTYIKISNLFKNTPARLKFLRSESVENTSINKTFKNIAIAHCNVAFKLSSPKSIVLNYSVDSNNQLLARVEKILGKDFIENSIYFSQTNPLMTLYGFIGNPTFTKHNADGQYFIVNGRALKDKQLHSWVKVAYFDVLFGGKYPCYAIFLDIKNDEVDVNVNPTKSEVRFKDIQLVRHLIISTIKKQLAEISNQNTSNTIGGNILDKAKLSNENNPLRHNTLSHNNCGYTQRNPSSKIAPLSFLGAMFEKNSHYDNSNNNTLNNLLNDAIDNQNVSHETNNEVDYKLLHPLGFAKAQLHQNWIISQTHTGFILVDQHAGHERINQEKLMASYLNNNIQSQLILNVSPLILEQDAYDVLKLFKDEIHKLGFQLDFLANNIVEVKSAPALLKNTNYNTIIKEIIDELIEVGSVDNFRAKLYDVVARIACHKSIRSGRVLNIAEMNDLLREMEKTPNYGQCPHGRPTFVSFKISDIEKFFGRG
jgi:DNA mismatch repair protein MutL